MNNYVASCKTVFCLLLFVISGCGGGGSTPSSTVYSVSLSADKTTAIASTSDHVAVTATVKDFNGLPVAGQEIQFNVPYGTYPYVSTGQTDANGTATINLSYPPVGPSHPKEVLVTATSGGMVSNGITITFSNPQQTPAHVSLTVDKESFSCNGADQVVFTITATDSNGSPMPGQTYAFNPSGPPGGPSLMGSGDSFTGANGQARMTMQCGAFPAISSPAVISVTATINGVTSNTVNVTATLP